MACPDCDCHEGCLCDVPYYTYLHSGVESVATAGFTLIRCATESPWLVVSNSPETLGPPTTGGWTFSGPNTLYKCELNPNGSQRIRVFVWHVNDFTDRTLALSLRIGCLTGGTITDIRGMSYVGNFEDILTVGMCLAHGHLYQALPLVAASQSIPALGAEVAVATWTATPKVSGLGCLVASVYEFTVSVSATLNLRVVATDSASWGAFSDAVAPPQDPGGAQLQHTRGWWPYSKVELRQPPPIYDASFVIGQVTYQQHGICENGGLEEQQFVQNPLNDPHGIGNKGCYGADLLYSLRAKAGSTGGWLKVSLRSRNTGTSDARRKYAGAAKIVDPTGPETPAVPKYPCKDVTGHAFDYMNSFDLLQFRASPQFIYVPPNAPDFVVKVLLANAGAATLPTNFLLSKSGVWFLPGGGAE